MDLVVVAAADGLHESRSVLDVEDLDMGGGGGAFR